MGGLGFGQGFFAQYATGGTVPIVVTAVTAGGDMVVPMDLTTMVVEAED